MNDATPATRGRVDRSTTSRVSPHFDVLIIGAGLSGIGAACHLVRKRPKTSFAILEARNAIGGTWDLFRYPGIRSDSDMPTFGYAFRPWDDSKAIADGPLILRYLAETARAYGVDRHIRFGLKVQRASWRTADARWTLDVDGPGGEKLKFSCNFLFLCTGYYEYAQGYTPGWPGMERFAGRIVHPQRWPEDLRYDGKRVVVIGSGATAVTIVPAMAARAAHIVVLQRSPTYVVARPTEEAIAERLKQWLPTRTAHAAVRWKNILLQMYLYRLSRHKPAAMRAQLLKLAQGSLAARTTPLSVCTPDTILGTSGCASPRTGTCSPPCAQARPRSSMVGSKPSSRRACASLRARRSKPTSLSRRPDLKFGSWAGSLSRSTARQSISRARPPTRA